MTTLRLRSSTFACLAGLSGLVLASGAAFAAELTIPMDQVRVMTFTKPAKTVFVGNPVIADITVIDRTHVFLMGKNLGNTNIVALDDEGREIANDQVSVVGRSGTTVTVQRGVSQTTLACIEERCSGSPTPGDDPTPFDTVLGERDRQQAQATAQGARAAAAEAGGQ
jgi:hypothetical protein